MPAKTKAQQALFGMALALRRKEITKSQASPAAIKIAYSKMSTQDIEDFASTPRKNLPEHLIPMGIYFYLDN